ncbi:hypothetical protein Rhow_000658 [Rhodococcus wratislaviensis]|uniref:Uncharacterized protein n=1 Tax=Rhodococcus wratislaviensis TaxID=44752 RepID=A0A402C2M7_RHOWR|nr:hypothetical protein [Rhodococcus wratislaviensis]GCE37812.1 hypothetical protein Rhow_000658 [Rhodococcus wratislaviensis]
MGAGSVHETFVDYDTLDYRRVSGVQAFEADARHVGMSAVVTR